MSISLLWERRGSCKNPIAASKHLNKVFRFGDDRPCSSKLTHRGGHVTHTSISSFQVLCQFEIYYSRRQ